MKIEGAIPRGQPMIISAPEVRRASAPPVFQPPCVEQFAPREVPPRASAAMRATLSSLRYQTLQNAPVARVNTTPPGPNSTDSQLASELEKHFGELHAFFKEGRVTQSSLRQIAAQALRGE